jgi:hypothetical protein
LDLEVVRVLVLLVVRQPQDAHDRELALHRDRHERGDQVRAVAGDDEIDLVDLEKLGVDAGDGGRVRLIVVGDHLDRPAEDPALLVHVVLPDLDGHQRRLAVRRQATGQRHAEPDLDRVRRAGDEHARAGEHQGARHGADQRPAQELPRSSHRYPLSPVFIRSSAYRSPRSYIRYRISAARRVRSR